MIFRKVVKGIAYDYIFRDEFMNACHMIKNT